ncbi:sulfite oxidase-like oxidoreductase [Aerophototrophica crusticola]|uniref:Sulfite oxidase-like oxidoreductase n=1 Tax=Aerophototrophica crusticola TaxID=1709002 RepID=A0A858RAB0_9PROT|nr:sulfite oxidase-like oxidoreductase [Rhodospirillaceae bacterium B3]
MAPDDQNPLPNAKLVESKQKWAEDGRLLTGAPVPPEQRLPPGQREVKNWPVLDLGIQPEIATGDWELAIDGLVENPVTWRWADFQAQPQVQEVSDIHCVTAWSRYDNRWEGVSAAHILATVRPKPEARHIVFHSYDSYTTNVRLDVFADSDVLLAHSWEGKPLTTEHGGPVRVIIPKFYFWKSAKWLKRIEFVAEDQPGFWELRGYHNEGNPWTEERYS